MVAHSGLRLQTLGNYQGDDGLRIGDFPELKIENNLATFTIVPALVTVRKELSKARHQYFTFLSEEGCGYLKDYLEERIRNGESITSTSPIITPKYKMKPFIRTINIGDLMRGAMRQAGFRCRPYVLRSFFDTQLMLAESKGLVLRDYRQFWMGHKGDIENRYTTNKRRLPDAVIDDMRQAYERSQEFLQTGEKAQANEDKLRRSFRKQLLLVAGLSEDEVDKMDLSSVTDEELQGIVRRKLLGDTTTSSLKRQVTNSQKQKVVKVEDTHAYLEKGWEYVGKLSEDLVIIRNGFEPNEFGFHPSFNRD
jgi:hypothetical protein